MREHGETKRRNGKETINCKVEVKAPRKIRLTPKINVTENVIVYRIKKLN
jgi:hypothetical protein